MYHKNDVFWYITPPIRVKRAENRTDVPKIIQIMVHRFLLYIVWKAKFINIEPIAVG